MHAFANCDACINYKFYIKKYFKNNIKTFESHLNL